MTDWKQSDPMYQWLVEFPDQLKNALNLPIRGKIPQGTYRTILLCGMGGSAIGGDLLADVLGGRLTVPLYVNRQPTLPVWVNQETLVVAASYSGNTDETLHACEVAASRGCTVCMITSGGKLELWASERSAMHIVVPAGYAPRAALGYMFTSFWKLLSAVGIAPDPTDPILASLPSLMVNIEKVQEGNSLARTITEWLDGAIPWVWATGRLGTVARRWANQFQENAKLPAHWGNLPEAYHNEIVGLCDGSANRVNTRIILLREKSDRTAEISEGILREAGFQVMPVIRGAEEVPSILELIQLGDWCSWYVATQSGTAPTPIPSIVKFKDRTKGI